MRERLEKLLENSSSTYYNYKVAAVVECKDGTLFEGVNVETSSPAAGICAERNALYTAITNGYKKGDFKAIHILSQSNENIYPCFICRQALFDFCDLDTKIISYGALEKEITVGDICKYGFGKDNLG